MQQPNQSTYGVDVAATRADDLDKKLLALVANGEVCTVLDLGCGSGGQSKRLAAAGAAVTAIDTLDYSDALADEESVTFIKGDMREVLASTSGQVFDAVLLQRAIHYLPYADALALLTQLRLITDRLFISVTGIDSDIGAVYGAKETVLPERFAQIDESARETFSIHEPVCLYSESEFMGLLQEAGWEIEELWLSAFLNIKAVARADAVE